MNLTIVELNHKVNEFLSSGEIQGITIGARTNQPYYYKKCNLRIGNTARRGHYLAFYTPTKKGVRAKGYTFIQLEPDGSVNVSLHFLTNQYQFFSKIEANGAIFQRILELIEISLE